MDLFNSVITRKPKKSRFVLNHEYAATMDFGYIYPFLCLDAVPGDKFRFGNEVLVNTATMSSPVYGRIDARIDYFFVPYRLLWDDWKDFITGGEDGQQKPTFPMLQLNDTSTINVGSIFDYMGIPPTTQFGVDQFPTLEEPEGEFSALPFRAYNFIWNEFYRNQNYQEEAPFRTSSDTEGEFADYHLLARCWRPDYYTSMLPTPQRGADVQIPVRGEGTLYGDLPLENEPLPQLEEDASDKTSKLRGATYDEGVQAGTFDSNSELLLNSGKGLLRSSDGLPASQPYAQVDVSSHTKVKTDGAELEVEGLGVSINDLRRANAVQVWLERNMRAGARYVEQILSHFGVRVPDYRLDRPEHIGGFSKPIQINQMQQLSQTTEDSYLGELGGRGFMYSNGGTRKYRVEEHGVILGLINLQPRAMYSQGLPKYFSKKDKFDFYFPEFANLGEQEVKLKEFYQPFNNDLPDETVGYLPRYSEYKYIPSTIHGGFLTKGLEHWTMSRFFTDVPYLDETSVQVEPDTDSINRIWNQTNVPNEYGDKNGFGHFYVRLLNYVQGKRPMPRYGTPKLIG